MEKRIYNVDSNGRKLQKRANGMKLQKRAGGYNKIYGDAENEDIEFMKTQREKIIKVLNGAVSKVKKPQELAELETAVSLAYGDGSKVFESSILKLEQNGSDVCIYEANELAGLVEQFDLSMEEILDEINDYYKEAEDYKEEADPQRVNQFKKDVLAVIEETLGMFG